MKLLLMVVTVCCTALVTCTIQNPFVARKTRLGAVEILQAKVDALEKKLPSKSTQVAFTVRFNADDPSNGISIGQNQILRFDLVVTNIGAGYDAHTGIFTAPVSGVYSFFLSIMSTNGRGGIVVGIVKEGHFLELLWTEGRTDPQDQGSTQVTTHLSSGQRVWVQQYYGDAIRGAWFTLFTGYLVQAD